MHRQFGSVLKEEAFTEFILTRTQTISIAKGFSMLNRALGTEIEMESPGGAC